MSSIATPICALCQRAESKMWRSTLAYLRGLAQAKRGYTLSVRLTPI